MSDLISREATERAIKDYFKGLIDRGIHEVDAVDCNAILSKYVISEIPTAYDMEKVVEHLIKRFDYCHQMANKNNDVDLEEMAFAWRQRAEGIRDAIEIVKGGGQGE